MTKLEEIATAIRNRVQLHFPDTEHLTSLSVELDIARAAVEAMREPTEAMIEAGVNARPFLAPYPPFRTRLRTTWPGMIDAILNEKPEGK